MTRKGACIIIDLVFITRRMVYGKVTKSVERSPQIQNASNIDWSTPRLTRFSAAIYLPKDTLLRLVSTLYHHDFQKRPEFRETCAGLKTARSRRQKAQFNATDRFCEAARTKVRARDNGRN